MDVMTERCEVIVVGGGQAGLAIGYFLAEQGRRFMILEASEAPAAAWRARWDSLRLFTPARYDGLPGRSFPGDPDRYPGRHEVVSYLTDYARDFDLPVELGSSVRSISRAEDDYLVELDDRRYESEQVVVATGPFQIPRMPAFAARLDPEIVQLHSSAYRTPRSDPGRPRASCRGREHWLSDRGGARRLAPRPTWRSDSARPPSAAHLRP